jgi:hypothetical protein
MYGKVCRTLENVAIQELSNLCVRCNLNSDVSWEYESPAFIAEIVKGDSNETFCNTVLYFQKIILRLLF